MLKVLYVILVMFSIASAQREHVSFQSDHKNSGQFSSKVGDSLDVVWQKDLGVLTGPLAGPAVKAGVVYMPTAIGLYLLSTENGDSLNFLPTGPIVGVPVITDNGDVIVVEVSGKVISFNSEGEVLWSRQLPGPVNSSPTPYDSLLSISTFGAGGALYVLKIDTGDSLWSSLELGSALNFATSGFGDSGNIYLTSWNPVTPPFGDVILWGFDRNGEQILMKRIGLFEGTSPNMPITIGPSGQAIWAQTWNGVFRQSTLFCRQTPGGDALWSKSFLKAFHASPAVDEQFVYLPTDEGLIQYSLSGGSLLNEYATGSNWFCAPVIDSEGSVFVGNNNGEICRVKNNLVTCLNLTGADTLTTPFIFGESVYIASFNGHVFRIGLPTVTGIHEETQIRNFDLAQNYPNPFNGETVIRYTISRPTSVKFSVFNLAGKEVFRLVNQKNEGSHLVKFDSADLPSGVYYYRLAIGGDSITKKMIILK